MIEKFEKRQTSHLRHKIENKKSIVKTATVDNPLDLLNRQHLQTILDTLVHHKQVHFQWLWFVLNFLILKNCNAVSLFRFLLGFKPPHVEGHGMVKVQLETMQG